MRVLAPAAVAALAAAAAAAVLAPAVRAAPSLEASLIAATTFEYQSGSVGGNCAETITHDVVGDVLEGKESTEGIVTFGNITVNGDVCGPADGEMTLVSQDVLDVFLEGGKILNLDSNASRAVFMAGADSEPRECGSTTFDRALSYAFTADLTRMLPSLVENKFVVEDDLPEVRAGQTWMLIAPQSSSGELCLYLDKKDVAALEKDTAAAAEADAASTDDPVDEEEEEEEEAEEEEAPADEEEESGTGSAVFDDAIKDEEAAEDDTDRKCFPGSATVQLEDGSVKTMDRLQLGDRVLVAAGLYSDVFMFTHKLANTVNDFVRLSTSADAQLSLTSGHYIYVNGALAAADTIKAGDSLELASGARTTVESVSRVKGLGLYNPQTVSGDIVVDGIRASTYTTAVQPTLAHNLLAPFRLAYTVLGATTGIFENGAKLPYNLSFF